MKIFNKMKTIINSGLKKLNLPHSSKLDSGTSPFMTTHENTFPVIHIDHKGRILYANKASFPLLREWNCLANDYLPDNLVLENPQLLNSSADFDLEIENRVARYRLDIVGFKESGYVGMYGYRTEYKPEEKTQHALHMEI